MRAAASIRLVLAALLAFVLALVAARAAAFTPPRLDGHVVDTAGKLTPAEIRGLDLRLDALRRRTGFEVVAFVVGSLEGQEIEDVAYDTFNTWQIGQKGADNGVLLVIAPSERRVRIETGRGVGGALTDLQTNDIIRERINPLLQQDRFREAIEQGTAGIEEALVAGTPENERQAQPRGKAPSLFQMGALFGLLLLTILLAIVSPGFRRVLFYLIQFAFFFGGRGGGGGGGSGYGGGGGRSGGGGSSDSY